MKILELLQSFSSLSSLLQKEKEWGGYVNLSTGEVEGPWEGERASFSSKLTPEEERAKGDQGWVAFHSHPADGSSIPEPSGQDLLVACLRGTPEYVITTQGIWEVKPIKVLPIEEVRRLDEEAWVKAQDSENQCGDPAYWAWKGFLKENLPVEVTLLGELGETG